MKNYLGFGWKFARGFSPSFLDAMPPSAKTVDIPHAPVQVPADYFDEHSYQDLFTYELHFDVPSFSDEEKSFLVFEGVMLKVHCYLNGHDLGERISGWVKASFDVTGLIKATGNRLLAVVDSREDPEVPPFGGAVDYLTFAGIYRPVYLERRPKTYIASLHATASANGHLSIFSAIAGEGKNQKISYKLSYGGKTVQETESKDFDIANPRLWDLSNPCLYSLEATLSSSDGVDKASIRVGFRDARFTNSGFFLNGKRVKLIGLNRHQNYPYVGPCLPDSAQREDAELLKIKFGCNVVRTSHYPQSEAFLSRCDEIGLLVIDEIPGWQYIGSSKVWRDNYMFFLSSMIEKERDHPSLIAYGTRIDESNDDDELYEKGVAYAHASDPSRQTLGVRNFKTSHCVEDIYSYNDFSCSNINHGLDDPNSWKGAKGKPRLVSEHNGHMFVIKQYDSASRRLENALRHLRVIDDAYKYDELSGAIGWCAFDYYTHSAFGSGNHICHHGVADMFRNPKASAYAYASQQNNLPIMWVANPPVVGDNDECLLSPLYVLTNCDYVELFKSGNYVGAFTPDKKDYPHLPHAPIRIDDFIGATFNEPSIKKKYWAKIKKALNLAGTVGFAHLKKKDLIPFIPSILHSHLDWNKLSELYGKYISSQTGGKPTIWTLKGYKDGKLVNEKKYGPSLSFSFRYEAYGQSLINDKTYDVSRVSIKLVDEFGTQLHYAHNIISFECLGPIEVIGPKTVSLIGGDISLYVRSLYVKEPTRARLIIHTEYGDDSLDFTVQ